MELVSLLNNLSNILALKIFREILKVNPYKNFYTYLALKIDHTTITTSIWSFSFHISSILEKPFFLYHHRTHIARLTARIPCSTPHVALGISGKHLKSPLTQNHLQAVTIFLSVENLSYDYLNYDSKKRWDNLRNQRKLKITSCSII